MANEVKGGGWIVLGFLVLIVYLLATNDRPATSEATPRTFTVTDFYWDDTTRPYQDLIVAGVNMVAKTNSLCPNPDPEAAYVSASRGTSDNPVFFVTCDGVGGPFNVFFSKAEVEDYLSQ